MLRLQLESPKQQAASSGIIFLTLLPSRTLDVLPMDPHQDQMRDLVHLNFPEEEANVQRGAETSSKIKASAVLPSYGLTESPSKFLW